MNAHRFFARILWHPRQTSRPPLRVLPFTLVFAMISSPALSQIGPGYELTNWRPVAAHTQDRWVLDMGYRILVITDQG